MFGRCACYFTDNFHVSGLGHVRFDGSVENFLRTYSNTIIRAGLSPDEVVATVRRELKRRRTDADVADENRDFLAGYQHRHPDLLHLRDEHLAAEFLALERDPSLIESYRTCHKDFGLFHFPLFSLDFCDRLSSEIDAFCASDLPRRKPNTMNKYGVIMGEMGMEPMLVELRERLQSLASKVFAEWCGDGLDSHRAFTVDYSTSADGQSSLDVHFDNAEVSVNVALSEDGAYSGGEIFFCKVIGGLTDPEQTTSYPPITHRRGWAILHRGRQLHGTLPVMSGQRRNLIVWMRSSTVRNRLCPMCGSKPKIIPVTGGYGDGFTIPSETSSEYLVEQQDREGDDVVDVCNVL